MLGFSSSARFFICKEAVDLRKGFEGLSDLVRTIFKAEIISGAFFVFINKSKNRIKVIYWDTDGLVIWYKRLEKGTFSLNHLNQNQVTRKDFLMLLEGIVPKRLQKRFSL